MQSVVSVIKPLTRWLGSLLSWPMVTLRDILQWIPWPVTVLAVGLLALHASGWRLALFCIAAFLYVALSGYWRQAMNTSALVGVAVPLSLLIGLAFGIWAQRTRIGSRVVPPMLDVMQTMPTFAYLIPILLLFGFGPVVGLIASAIYACPPMVRNVMLGLSRVPSEFIEASRMSRRLGVSAIVLGRTSGGHAADQDRAQPNHHGRAQHGHYCLGYRRLR